MGEQRIDVHETSGDVIGAGISGSGHVIGKEVTIRGHVIQLVNPSAEAVAALNEIGAMPTAVQPDDPGGLQAATKPGNTASLQQSINDLLELLQSKQKPGDKDGKVEAAGVQVSQVELLLKKAVLLKTDADQMYFDHMARKKPEMDAAKKGSGGATFQLDIGALLADFDADGHTAKLQQAYEILEEANQLDPANVEVLLNMAQLLIDLTPDDPTDEQRLLYRIQTLISEPKNETERFHLAQAKYLMATSGETTHPDLLKDARKLFVKAGRDEWVRQCDDMLAQLGQPSGPPNETRGQAPAGAVPPVLGQTAVAQFEPTGRWKFQITDAFNSVMYVDFYPTGTFSALQQAGAFGQGMQAQGQWFFNPANQTLQLSGIVGGYMPFMLGIVIQRPQMNGFQGIGSDNCAYFITRES
jgi:hypothetical protein